jgi:O-antigen ligase
LRQSGEARDSLGGSRVASTLLFFVTLSLLLLAAGLERRSSGSSPFLTLPALGRVLQPLADPSKLRLVLVLTAIVSLLLALLFYLRRASHRGFPPALPGLLLWVLWLGWLLIATAANPGSLPPAVFANFATCVALLLTSMLLLRQLALAPAVGLAWAVTWAVILANYLVWVQAPSWALTTTWTGGFLPGARLQGTFPQPNVAGLLFGVLLLFVLSQHPARAATRWTAAIGLGGLLLATGSRGALVLTVVGVVVLRSHCPRRRVTQIGVGGLMVSAALPVLGLEAYVNGRDSTWRLALDMAQQAPVTGAGAFPVPTRTGVAELEGPLYAHNQLFQSFAEVGLVGVLLLVLAFAAGIRAMSPDRTGWGASAVAGILATFPLENPIRVFEPAFLPLILILLLALAVGAQEHREHEPSLNPGQDHQPSSRHAVVTA